MKVSPFFINFPVSSDSEFLFLLVRRSKRTLEIKAESSSGFQSKLLLSKKRISPRHTKKPPVAAAATKVAAAGSKTPKKKTKEKKASPSKAKTPSPKAKKSTSDTSNNVSPDKNFSVDNKPVKKAYVVFVGNLPYNVTKEQLEEHFRKTGIDPDRTSAVHLISFCFTSFSVGVNQD